MNRASYCRRNLCFAVCLSMLAANVGLAATPDALPAAKPNTTTGKDKREEQREKSGLIETNKSQALLRAYQREFAVLETEKRMLQQRLEKMRLENETRMRRAKEEHSKYETELMAVSLLADQKERELARREIEGEQNDQVGEVVGTIEAQAKEVLNKGLVARDEAETNTNLSIAETNVADGASIPKRLELAFTAALQKLSGSNAIESSRASFFDVDGKKVEGQILRVGQIAAFGITESGAQALAPAGGGALKIWPQSQVQELDTKNAATSGLPLQIFLSDNWSHAIEERKEKTPLQIVQDGGTIAWVIVGLGIFALLLSVVRTVNLYWVGRGVEKQGGAVVTAIKEKDYPLAEQVCDNNFAISDLLRAVLRSRELSRDSQHDLMDEHILRIFARIDRFGQMILVAAAVAPLLGLLGTVTGMISTFDAITEFGTGDPRVLAGGISEALITTELGLIVAIPSLLLGNLLSGYAERLKGLFETRGLQAANLCRETDDTSTPTLIKNEPVWTRVS